MKTFEQFLEYALAPPNFNELMAQAETAYERGKYDIAWELVNQAQPSNEEENSYKIHFLSALQNKQTEFLQDMKKRSRRPI